MLLLSFIEGMGFDPFFRGFLSVLVGIVVLCGAVFLMLATNSGTRTGFFLAATGLFGWMFLMGIVWTVYGIGWHGPDPVWAPVEINRGQLDIAATPEAQQLAGIDIGAAVPDDITDPDERNLVAAQYADQISDELGEWRLLVPGDGDRGEAQATADALLVELGVFGGPEQFVPLEFGAFARGGKEEVAADANALDRVGHWFRTTVIQPFHPQHLSVIQVQRVVDQFVEPGQPPPLPIPDGTAPVVSVIMERDMGGPLPQLIGGRRFTPLMFTLFSGIVFVVLAASLHNRDRRESEIRSRTAV